MPQPLIPQPKPRPADHKPPQAYQAYGGLASRPTSTSAPKIYRLRPRGKAEQDLLDSLRKRELIGNFAADAEFYLTKLADDKAYPSQELFYDITEDLKRFAKRGNRRFGFLKTTCTLDLFRGAERNPILSLYIEKDGRKRLVKK